MFTRRLILLHNKPVSTLRWILLIQMISVKKRLKSNACRMLLGYGWQLEFLKCRIINIHATVISTKRIGLRETNYKQIHTTQFFFLTKRIINLVSQNNLRQKTWTTTNSHEKKQQAVEISTDSNADSTIKNVAKLKDKIPWTTFGVHRSTSTFVF